ncbi:MAG TPA: pantetheine-phosphate adenylyltransferase [Candidatus Faeciplasma avium]|uniref:Phosphopantetheine adenylyltransferase n=1 Tax=Candidatus Faeciplasma avium TaxID=2840798 RepID=A0A9D1NPY6_9FIRM|nr:pantetheine-phosphate adenylyltransferase [Candidatus Faeciplasma avium]
MNNLSSTAARGRRIAVCPGSFDPVTLGHLDIMQRASQLFDRVIVLVSVNFKKSPSFTPEERVEMIKRTAGHLKNIEVETFDGLLADFVRQKKATAIVKGLRAVTDFEYEFQMALANKKLCPEAETVFLVTRSENMYLSSSVVKQIASFGGDISGFVPPQIKDFIASRLCVRE